jgi:hypothetical protein
MPNNSAQFSPCSLLPPDSRAKRGETREMNKGVKRLAILLGGLSALCAILVALMTVNFRDPDNWLLVIAFAPAAFLIPFGLVHAIAWVVRGFKQ